jgi:PDZ domain-containing protein
MKRLYGAALVVGLLGVVTAFVLWWLPADDFLFVPDRAKPLEDKVEVEGGRTTSQGDVYYVDIFVRRIRLLEQLLPFTRPEGATLEPEERVAPAGESDEERRIQNAEDMQRSEQIAALVALRALGYRVSAVPRGVLVTTVFSDVPARRVLDPGDLIVAVNDVQVRTTTELRSQIARVRPGAELRMTVRRDGKPVTVTVRTIPKPGDPDQAAIGVLIEQDAKIELPFEVDIDLGRVGGPSAGLPFALEIARQLGRDVTKGCRIAATGALAIDGTVIPIGGVKQKTIGVERAGVDYFVVPAGDNAADARKEADDVEVIPVDSFQQALRKLATSVEKC